MLVKLLRWTPEPEETCALAARLCYSPSGVGELKEEVRQGDFRGFLKKVLDMGHLSILEHANFTFGIEGISRATSHQLVRHRLASYAQQSQRYVAAQGEMSYVTPSSIESHQVWKERFANEMRRLKKLYDEMVAEGIPIEDARYVLPNAIETKIIVTMNARELLHFFRVRGCNRAQWEIRELAKRMLALVRAVAPVIFRDAGPPCVGGECSEGKMTCGQAEGVRREFKSIAPLEE